MTRLDTDDPGLPLQVLFARYPAAVAPFHARGMLCFGCPIAPFHTMVDACLAYELDEGCFRVELQRAIAALPTRRRDRTVDPLRKG